MLDGLVSVILPVYNGAAFLEGAIRSVLNQSYPRIEIVAVDDGSTDASPSILASFSDSLRIVTQPNAGVAAARNAAIAQARGEFVAFLDQDDAWRPAKVARQVAAFRASNCVGLIHTDVDYLDAESGELTGPQDPTARPELMVGDCFEALLLGNPLCNSSVMLRSSVLHRVGPCDLRIRGNTVQDYDLWLRVAQVSQLAHVPEPLTVFRLHPAQGHRDRRAMLQEELGILLRIRPEAQWWLKAEWRDRLARLYDSLAVAHMDQDEPEAARTCFAEALRYRRSPRQLVRFAVSRLPSCLVQKVRRTKERLSRSEAGRAHPAPSSPG